MHGNPSTPPRPLFISARDRTPSPYRGAQSEARVLRTLGGVAAILAGCRGCGYAQRP